MPASLSRKLKRRGIKRKTPIRLPAGPPTTSKPVQLGPVLPDNLKRELLRNR